MWNPLQKVTLSVLADVGTSCCLYHSREMYLLLEWKPHGKDSFHFFYTWGSSWCNCVCVFVFGSGSLIVSFHRWQFSPFTVFVFYSLPAFKLISVGFSWKGMWMLIQLYQLNRGPIVNELSAAWLAWLSSLEAAQLHCACMLMLSLPLSMKYSLVSVTHTHTHVWQPCKNTFLFQISLGVCFALDVRLGFCSRSRPAGICLLFCHIRIHLAAGSPLLHILGMGIPIWRSGWQVG